MKQDEIKTFFEADFLPPSFDYEIKITFFDQYLKTMEDFLENKRLEEEKEFDYEKQKLGERTTERLNNLKVALREGGIPLSDPQFPDYQDIKQQIYQDEFFYS